MRTLVLFSIFLLPCGLVAQSPVAQNIAATPSATQTDLSNALAGDWTGVLEYRDYSEPPTSTKRVQLPTWLSIAASGKGLVWNYIYDDGPTKTVTETDRVSFDPALGSYSEADNGKPPKVYSVTGYEGLRSGRGQLVLSGTGTDNDKPAETRVTLTIRRNLLTVLEEVRPAGSTGAYVFRHNFTFTRAHAPQSAPAM